MDFSKCFDILSSRKHADPNCPCCTIPPIPPVSTDHQGDFAYLQQKSNLELIESFFHLQTQRIETYRLFDTQLEALMSARALASYPQMCESITKIFSDISKEIIKIKEEFSNRRQVAIVKAISSLQAAEKEKLTLTAARHLDRMRMDLPSINSVAGEVSMDHRQYVDDKMNTIVEQINDALEEIQAMKLDFMES